MKLTKAFKHALNMVMHSKMRSWLTIIGIVIGVASVVSIMSIGPITHIRRPYASSMHVWGLYYRLQEQDGYKYNQAQRELRFDPAVTLDMHSQQ
ncbi:MAG: hypothetical protein C5S49_01645 [Candidatus Methanogaster sp.]|nr:MAG: hypothetical protein C5S49_01645 [ANME-2 cluster archaeon]